MDTPLRFLRFLIFDNGAITLVAALGFVAIYWLLPRPTSTSRGLGVLAAGLALVFGGALIVRAGVLRAEALLFYAFSGIAILAGGLLVTQSNPARAALSFSLVVLSTCGLFLLLAAPFLMAATTIIYAGAIIVTFLFVLMLAQQTGAGDADRRSREPLLAALTGFVLLGGLLFVLQRSYGTDEIDELLARVRGAKQAEDVKAMVEQLGEEADNNQAFFTTYRKAVLKEQDRADVAVAAEVQSLAQKEAERILNLQYSPNERDPSWARARETDDVEVARLVLEQLEQIGLRARASFAALQPRVDRPLSPMSGPPANVVLFPGLNEDPRAPDVALRRDAATLRPELPADNTAYLGRSLFTDNLLAVELAGTLLLVATIGAIAIAQRRGEKNA